jgi:hypothetical protein
LVFLRLDVQHDMNFVEIMKEGWLFSFSGAIDFTDKNGEKDRSDCLHRETPDNPYLNVMTQVVQNIEQYASKVDDFSLWGFGGIPNYIDDNGNPV